VSAATDGAEVDACKVFAAMSFDVSTQQAVAKTQDQINAGLNLLPQNDPLRSDMLDAETDLLMVDGDLVTLAVSSTPSASQQADLKALRQALGKVRTDCSGQGVPFTANLQTSSY